MALDLPTILDLNGLFDGLVYKNISEIYLLLSEVGLWTDTLTFEFQRQSLLSTADIAVRHTFVMVSLGGHNVTVTVISLFGHISPSCGSILKIWS